MCGPAAAGTAYSAYSSAQQQKYEARVADANAKQASAAASESIQLGKVEQQRQYRELAQIKGAQQARMAANGIDTGFGSAALLASDTAMIGAEDASALNKNIEARTKGFDITATNYRSSAAASRYGASTTMVSGALSTGKTLLDGANQLSRYKAGQKVGS